MALHSTAQGLATLGRHGDSVLVHMQPQEVAGLQALAKSQGTSLTVNPNTGMPEAFNLGNFFSSLLPTLAGFMVGGPAGASLGLKAGTTAATLAPIAAGVATGAAVAGAKGEDVLSGALMGGLGGFGGGNLGSAFGKMGAANIASTAGIPSTAGGYTTPAMEEAFKTGVAGPILPNAQAANTSLLQSGTYNPALSQSIPGATVSNLAPMSYSQSLGQMGSGAMDLLKTGGYDKFVSPEIGGSAMQLGSSLGLPVFAGLQPKPYDSAADEARRKAEEDKYRSKTTGGLNLSPSSGLNLTGFAMGGQVDMNPSVGGGLSDLYNRPEGNTTQSISRDGYGMGRLDRLSQQGSLAKAGDMFYAQGGPVSFADGGDTGMNVEGLGSLNVNTGMQSGAGMGAGRGEGLNKNFSDLMFESMYRGIGPETVRKMLGMSKAVTQNVPKSYALNVISGQQEPQYARGGYLNGAGDGMSDSIPATIEGKQPARLADGEFVVPADVVSHLGNGSSKAGSKKLYAMLDKVRHARTGNKKQGKQINPAKYMPA